VWDNYKVETLRKLLIVFVAVFGWHQGLAQVSILSTNTPKGIYAIKGDYYFEHNNYVKAVENYSISTNKNDTHLMLRMAEAYQKLGNEELATHWHDKAISINPESELINSSKDKSEAVLLNSEGLSVYCSNGDVIELSNSGGGNLVFDFIPGISYWLIINYDNYKDESQVRLLNKIKILKSDNYTFHIQKLVEAASEQSEGSKRLQDFHVNPGDLITFQLIPNPSLNSDLIDSRIRFKDKDATINSNDTLVFSYVAEEISKTPGINNTATNDELDEVSEDNLALDDKASDTISMTEPILPAFTELQKEDQKEEDIPLNVNPEEVALQDKPEVIDQVIDDIMVNDSTEYSTPVVATNPTLIEHDEDQKEEDIPLDVNLEEVALQDEPNVIDQVLDDIMVNDSIEYSTPVVATNPTLIAHDEDQNKDEIPLNVYPEEVALQDEPKVIDQVLDDIITDDTTKDSSTPLIATDPLKGQEKIVAKKEISDSKLEMDSERIIDSSQPERSNDDLITGEEESIDFLYRVQIAAARNKMSDAQLKRIYKGFKTISSFEEEGYYKYYIAETPSYPAARQTLKECGVDDAFIAVYKKNVKWKLQDVLAYQKKEPVERVPNTTVDSEPNKSKKDPNLLLVKNEVKTSDKTTLNPDPVVEEILPPSGIVSKLNNEELDQENEEELPNVGKSSNGTLLTGTARSEYTPLSNKEHTTDDSITLSESDVEMASNDQPNDIGQGTDERNNDFLYRVQIAAVKTKISDVKLNSLHGNSDKINYVKEDGYYKYNIAETPNYFVARQVLEKSKVENAFIVAYKGDKKLKVEDAIAIQYKKPTAKSELAKSDSILKIETVNFEFNEFTLPAKEMLYLRKNVIDPLKANKSYYAIVNGYTDIRGSEEYNYGLSQERALYVYKVIISEGISSERVKTQFFGESQLIKFCSDNDDCDESVHQANRRAEVLLLISKQ
jgi:outer membrane protein OmpA-like peptidoglycan-associated protein/tetratricopeptide (TPR) repeat protein